MTMSKWNGKALLGIGVLAGVAQAFAGAVMYIAGVYFAPWSMGVSGFLLLLSIVVSTRWYAAHYLNGAITYKQALGVGIAVSVCTGLVYAIYNIVSISWFYPAFLDDLVRARIGDAAAQPRTESFAALRAQVSAPGIAISNCIRLSVFGSVLSLLSSFFLKREGERGTMRGRDWGAKL